jgi:DNA sulfur modification protein DndE
MQKHACLALSLALSLAGTGCATLGLSGQTSAAAPSGSGLQGYLDRAPFKMAAIPLPAIPDHTVSIADFGAVGDGVTLNTDAFAKAIAACVQAGGGHVVVPAGLWLTGPIVLKSNIDLHAERGALIQFTPDHTAYPMVPREGRGFMAMSAITANGQSNIALTGEGIYDGAGDTWRPAQKRKASDDQWKELLAKSKALSNHGLYWWPTEGAMNGENYLAAMKERTPNPTGDDYLPARDFLRPAMISMGQCQNILIDGVTLRNSPSGIFSPDRCTNLTISNATFFNEWWAMNGDGMDINNCFNVAVYRCTLSTGDDAICMKASGDKLLANEPGLQRVVVAECTVYHGHGGFVVGGSTDSGMDNLWCTQCQFINTDVGIRAKSGIGHGGLVQNIFVDHIVMKDILNEAILFTTFYDNTPTSNAAVKVPLSRDPAKTPEFKDFHISDIYCLGARSAISITGLPQRPVHGITIERAVITAKRGLSVTDAKDITLHQVKINASEAPLTEKNTSNIQITE